MTRPARWLAGAAGALACLACGGLGGGGASDDDVAVQGCQAAAQVMAERFTQPPARRRPEPGVCQVESRGDYKGSGVPDGDLAGAFSGWDAEPVLVADGLDGSQLGFRRGETVCKVHSAWELLDIDTFETAHERAQVTCGPLAAVR